MASVTEMAFVSAQVPRDLLEQVTQIAKDNDRPRSSEIRQALKAHVEAHANSAEPEPTGTVAA